MTSIKNVAATLATSLVMASGGLAATSAQAETAVESRSKVGLWVVLNAKAGKEEAVAKFLLGGRALVGNEPATNTWYAIRLTPSRFAIFDTFPDDAGREAHLSGKVAAALMASAPDLLQTPPSIEKIDVLAVKLPAAK